MRSALGNGNVILNVKQLQSVSVYGTTVQGGTHKIHIPPAQCLSWEKIHPFPPPWPAENWHLIQPGYSCSPFPRVKKYLTQFMRRGVTADCNGSHQISSSCRTPVQGKWLPNMQQKHSRPEAWSILTTYIVWSNWCRVPQILLLIWWWPKRVLSQ